MKRKLIIAIAIGTLSTTNHFTEIKAYEKNGESVETIAKENEILCSELYHTKLDGIINSAICYKNNQEVINAWSNKYEDTFKEVFELVTNNKLDININDNNYATSIYMSFMQLSSKDFIENEESFRLLNIVGIKNSDDFQKILNILLPAHLTNNIEKSLIS